MLVVTASGLAIPALAQFAIDHGISAGDKGMLLLAVGLFVVAGRRRLVGRLPPDLPVELGRRARPARPAHRHVPPPDAPGARATTSGPPPAARVSRLTSDIEALEQLVTDGVTSLVINGLTFIGVAVILFAYDVAAGPAHLRDLPRAGHRDGPLPRLLGPRLPAHPRARGRRAGDAAGDAVGHPRRAGLRPPGALAGGLPARQRRVPRGQHGDDPALGRLLPGRRVPVGHRHRDHPVLRRDAGARPGHEHRRDGGLHRLPVELLRPDPAALPALQHLPVGHGGPREDLRRARHRARDRRRPRGRAAGAHRGADRAARRDVRLRPHAGPARP